MARLHVRLTPRSGRDAIEGFERDARGLEVLRVRVAAPPLEGRANVALERLLAGALRVPPSTVRVVGGHAARSKVVEVEGLDPEELRARLDVARR